LVPFSLGRLTAITRDGHAVAYTYDRFGRTTQDGELAYGYDANGNRTTIGYPGGVMATYGFDFADRETTLTVTTPEGSTPVVTGVDPVRWTVSRLGSPDLLCSTVHPCRPTETRSATRSGRGHPT
jgi:hypothetical protein